MNSLEDRLNQRLEEIKSWAKNNNFLMIQGDGPGSIFSLCGKNGRTLVTFYEKSKYKGEMYAYIADGTFPGDLGQRDTFVNEIKRIKFYDKNMDVIKIVSHKHFQKKLQDLTDEELEKFLNILGKYCH